ncbi:hypothetical protein C8R47DRAFT_999800 [Mycena vitilis]|nr:hypothetical protein C8R47DRAFT_999800 [Mycena vitilis]
MRRLTLRCCSIGTIVHYGYRETGHPHLERLFLGLCLLMALGSSVLPFVAWFDRYENRLYRLVFFLALVFSAAAPVAGLAVLCGRARRQSSSVRYAYSCGRLLTHVLFTFSTP